MIQTKYLPFYFTEHITKFSFKHFKLFFCQSNTINVDEYFFIIWTFSPLILLVIIDTDHQGMKRSSIEIFLKTMFEFRPCIIRTCTITSICTLLCVKCRINVTVCTFLDMHSHCMNQLSWIQMLSNLFVCCFSRSSILILTDFLSRSAFKWASPLRFCREWATSFWDGFYNAQCFF